MQQCTVPFKIMPGNQKALAVCRPVEAHQSVPSLHEQIPRFACGCGAEVDLSVVGPKNDDCSLRTIEGQAPIAVGIDLRGVGTLPVPNIEPKRFPSISLGDAVQADRRWQACTLHVPDADVFQD